MKCNLRVFISDFASVRYDGVDWVWRKGNGKRKAEARIKTPAAGQAVLLKPAQALRVEVRGRESYGGHIASIDAGVGEVKLSCELEGTVLTKEE